VQRLQVEAAVQMLETTRLSIDEISVRVGYANSSTLSRLLRRQTQTAPRELRRRSLSRRAAVAIREPS
jgi:transcriptional regulator GlxA family with amidase domain